MRKPKTAGSPVFKAFEVLRKLKKAHSNPVTSTMSNAFLTGLARVSNIRRAQKGPRLNLGLFSCIKKIGAGSLEPHPFL